MINLICTQISFAFVISSMMYFSFSNSIHTSIESTSAIITTSEETIMTSEETTVCEGDTIQVFGQPVFSQTSLSETFTSASGCDSIHTVNVLLLNDTLTVELIYLCQGDSLTIDGYTYTINSLIVRPSTGINGCDSTHFIDIDIVNTFQASDSIIICQGDSVMIGNQNIYSDTTFAELVNGPNSCDTMYTYYVSTAPTYDTQEEISICQGDTIQVFGQPVFEQNTFTQTFASINNCDSTHTVNVLLYNTYLSDQLITLCQGDSVKVGNVTYYQDTLLFQNFTTINGCDSIKKITISFNDAVTLVDTAKLCVGESVTFFGDTITDVGFFEYIQVSIDQGCDTINQLWVEVFEDPDVSTFIDPACLGEDNGMIEISNPQSDWMYSLDGTTFQNTPFFEMLSSGIYELWVEDAIGCMSQSTFEITNSTLPNITLTDEVVVQLGDTLTMPVTYSNVDNLQFNWSPVAGLSCSTCPFPIIIGEESQTYIVEITDVFGCSTSESIDVDVRTECVFIPNAFSPNGDDNNDRFTIFTCSRIQEIDLFQVYDNWGELVFEATNFTPNDEELGWDGNFKGEYMNNGVFVYLFKIRIPNQGVVVYKGDVTLIR